jgi:hypothetical protein
MNDEVVLTGGEVNRVTRKGNTVYRSGGPWVPAVQSLLQHLQDTGFDLAPLPLGVADDGREMISFLPGDVMPREKWRPEMLTDDAVVQAGTMLRRLHAATVDLVLPADTVWRGGQSGKRRGQIVRHGDLGPWNTLWEGCRLTGLIDWDFAEPGHAITDLAQMALYFVPLRGAEHARSCGIDTVQELPHRLRVLCATYGEFTMYEVVREIERLQLSAMKDIEERAEAGLYPWTMFRENGENARTVVEVAWLREMFPTAFPSHLSPVSLAAS